MHEPRAESNAAPKARESLARGLAILRRSSFLWARIAGEPSAAGKRLQRNIATGAGTAVLWSAIALVTYPQYVKLLGFQLYGVWLLLGSISAMAQFGNLGLSVALARTVASEYQRGKSDRIPAYVRTTLASVFVVGTLLTGALITWRGPLLDLAHLTGIEWTVANRYVPVFGAFLVCDFAIEALGGTLSGFGRIGAYNVSRLGGQLVMAIVSVLGLQLGYGFESLVVAGAGSRVFMLVSAIGCLRPNLAVGSILRPAFDYKCFQHLLSFGGSVVGGSMLNVIVSPFHRFLLARFAGTAAVAVYDVSLSASLQIRNVFDAGLRALMPEASGRSTAARSRATIAALWLKTTLGTTAVGILTTLVLLACSGPLFAVWLRPADTSEINGAFRILLVAAMINLAVLPSYYTLLGMGEAGRVLTASVLQTSVNILMCLFLSLALGRFNPHLAAFATLGGTLALAGCFLVHWIVVAPRYREVQMRGSMAPAGIK